MAAIGSMRVPQSSIMSISWPSAAQPPCPTPVRLDHVVLAPGSAWPYRAQWRQFAQELPADTVLLIPPDHTLPLRPVLEQLARLLQAEGHQHPKGVPVPSSRRN